MKKTISIALAVTLTFALLFTQGNVDAFNKVIADSDVEIWGASALEKVMQDYPSDESIKTDAKIDVISAKNEHESAQIIITPKAKDVKSYDVKLHDLKLTDDASVVYSADNVTLYNQYYIRVTNITNPVDMPLGCYPDALVPFDKAKESKENSVKKGNNQGIYYSFYVPEDQRAGTYKGDFDLIIDGVTTKIPVTLEVYDISVPTAVRNKSIFRVGVFMGNGDLNSTQQMLNAYNDTMTEFRLSSGNLVLNNTHSDEDVEYFTELALKNTLDERVGSITMPYKDATMDGDRNFDDAVMKKYVRALVKKSYESNVDLFQKIVMYFTLIDEPYLQDTWERVRKVENHLKTLKDEMKREILSEDVSNTELKEKMAESFYNIPHVLTNKYYEPYADCVEGWCPHVDDYNAPEQRELYKDQPEKWWYTCTNPKNPYPTYHIDDWLVSSRLLSWMQAEYGVVGNLLWATDLNCSYRNNEFVLLEDYMQTADRYPTANGDGFLFYPGAKYGLDAPLTTIRLHSIRDGLEEYEMLEDIADVYESALTNYGSSAGFGSDKILNSVYRTLYSGTKVATTTELFTRARKNVMQLKQLAEKAGVSLVDFEKTETTAKYSVLVADGTTVNVVNATKKEKTKKNGYTLYEIEKEIIPNDNYFRLTATAGGKTYSFEQYLGGGTKVYSVADYKGNTVIANNGSTNVVSGQSIGYDYDLLRVSFPNNKGKKLTHKIQINSNFLGEIGTATDKFIIEIYNGGEDVVYELRFKYSDKTLQYVIDSGTLTTGKNVIEISNLYGYNWGTYGKLTDVYVLVGEEGRPASNDIYLGKIKISLL